MKVKYSPKLLNYSSDVRKRNPFSGVVFFLRRQAHIESGKARYIEFARLKEAGKYIEQRKLYIDAPHRFPMRRVSLFSEESPPL